jgi:hypothetical protein
MPFDFAIGMMTRRITELLPSEAVPEPFSTVEACSYRLRQLVSESCSANADSPTYWPFIKKVRVYLKAHILSKGLIIADLPGLRDLNSARKAITERYVLQCHQIFIVADIARAITDESIKDVFELARGYELNKVDIVCTMADSITVDEATSVDWPAKKETIKNIQGRIAANKLEIQWLNDTLKTYPDNLNILDSDEITIYSTMRRDLGELIESNDKDNFELLRIVIGLRNEKVKSGLREAYRDHALAENLNVFCVGNIMYRKNRDKPVATALPYLNLSGILNLRRYCIGIVAQSRFHATRQFIKDTLPAFVGSVGLWVEAGSVRPTVDSKERIIVAMSSVQQEIDEVR